MRRKFSAMALCVLMVSCQLFVAVPVNAANTYYDEPNYEDIQPGNIGGRYPEED